jgi:hypothetical protein
VTSVYDAIRYQAMLAVVDPDEAALLRRVRRWYSKTLNTPLAEVEALDPFMILREYWEEHYSDLEDDRREQEIEDMLETREEAIERDRDFQREEVASIRIRKKIEKNEALAAAAKAAGQDAPTAAKPFMKFAKPQDSSKDPSLSKLPSKKVEPDVKVSFVTDDDFEAAVRGDALGQSKP